MAMTASQNAAINKFVQENLGNPQAIIDGMKEFGVSAQDMANATGQSMSMVGQYLSNAGAPAGFGGSNPGPVNSKPGVTANAQPELSKRQNQAIYQFWRQNQNNPAALKKGMEDFGISGQQFATAIGKPLSTVRGMFADAGFDQNFGGISNGKTTEKWQQVFNDFAKQTGTQAPNLNQQGFEWLKNSDDPLAAWKSVNAYNYGYAGHGASGETASANSAFGPGQTQANANNINAWGSMFNDASKSMQANGGVPNWNQPTPGSYAAQQIAQQNGSGVNPGQSTQSMPQGTGGYGNGSGNGSVSGSGSGVVGGGGLGFGSGMGQGGFGGTPNSVGYGGYGGYGTNPYLQDMANSVVRTADHNLYDVALPSIRSGALAAGQYGGTRQGVAEGVAIGRNNDGIAGAISSLYGNAYNTDQSNTTQRIGQNQQYALGQGNLALNANTANQNFYTSQRGQDLQQYGIGANLFQAGAQGNLGIGAGQYGLGQSYMNAPMGAMQQYSNFISPYSGMNSTVAPGPTPNAGMAGIGGAMAGYQFGQNLGGGQPNYNYGNNNVYGSGYSGPSYGGGTGQNAGYGGSTYGGNGSAGY